MKRRLSHGEQKVPFKRGGREGRALEVTFYAKFGQFEVASRRAHGAWSVWSEPGPSTAPLCPYSFRLMLYLCDGAPTAARSRSTTFIVRGVGDMLAGRLRASPLGVRIRDPNRRPSAPRRRGSQQLCSRATFEVGVRGGNWNPGDGPPLY